MHPEHRAARPILDAVLRPDYRVEHVGVAKTPFGELGMVSVTFTPNIQRHVSCPPGTVEPGTVRRVLDHVFAHNEAARGYVLDDRGALRRHMVVFVNGVAIRDRVTLADEVPDGAEVYIMQALSGG